MSCCEFLSPDPGTPVTCVEASPRMSASEMERAGWREVGYRPRAKGPEAPGDVWPVGNKDID